MQACRNVFWLQDFRKLNALITVQLPKFGEAMPTKSLKLDSLDLDLENPRIRKAADQREAMQNIITEQKAKLINLAESIAVKGFSPIDRCLVMRSAKRTGHFVVLEGNRRVLAAKLLKNPSLVSDLDIPEGHKKRLHKSATEFDATLVEPVDCWEVDSREDGVEWIRQRSIRNSDGGIIGGRDQTGPWKIDARYNARELVSRIEAIARMRDRIELTRQDALRFLTAGVARWPEETLIYLDPPYYAKGRDLYYDFYKEQDHGKVADFVTRQISRQKWIVSYDNVPQIRSLYSTARHVVYSIGYSAREASQGSEVMFFCDPLKVPPLVGSIQMTEDHAGIWQRRA